MYPTEDSSTKTLPIILGIVGGVVIISISCLFSLRSKLKSAISQRTVTPAQKGRIWKFWSLFSTTHEIIFLFTFFLFFLKQPKSDTTEAGADSLQLREIIEATDNFNKNNKLGEGGFGPVYKVCMYICTYCFKPLNCMTWHFF